jgi:hypothetical protein
MGSVFTKRIVLAVPWQLAELGGTIDTFSITIKYVTEGTEPSRTSACGHKILCII